LGHGGAPPVVSAASSARARSPHLKGFVPVPVLGVYDETPTVKTIRLARPEGFAFEAGQFVTVRVRVDGQEHARCYSISSPPDASGYFEISVKRQGLVSNALHASVRVGAFLVVKAPAGAFRYPARDDRPIVLLAAGIGVTPLMSMLRHAVLTEPTRPVTLLYGARSHEELAFHDELTAIARRHPQIRVFFAVSQSSRAPDVYPGRLDESLVRTTIPDLAHAISLICGPQSMIDDMRVLLARNGVPQSQIRFEVFQAAVAAAAGVKAQRSENSSDEETGLHRMECNRTGRRIPIPSGTTLLEAAEAAGVDVASLCRSGVCGTCRVRVSSGDVTCESNVLDADDRNEGYVLACVTTTRSDCVVEI
jgi:ferredoxin-NADP reductase